MPPPINIEWVDADTHRAGMSAFLSASKRRLSFVDCVSFEAMRAAGIRTAFAFDPHFGEYGFIKAAPPLILGPSSPSRP